MDEQERFNEICKPRFDELVKGNREIIELLKGKNGDPGLLDDVRQLKSRWRSIFAAIGILFTAIIAQTIHWVWGLFQ